MASDTRASRAIRRAACLLGLELAFQGGEIAFRQGPGGEFRADVGDHLGHVAAVGVGGDDDAAARIFAADLIRAVALLDAR
jgi:hypothetical protein